MANITLVARVVEIRQKVPGSIESEWVAVCEHHHMDHATGHIHAEELKFDLPDGFIQRYEEKIRAHLAEHKELAITALQDMVREFVTPHGGVKKASEDAPRPEGWGVFA